MSNQPQAFFASPFAPEYRWIRSAVAIACREMGVELRAVDEVIQPGASIISAIHREIDSADLAFAVLTGFNPGQIKVPAISWRIESGGFGRGIDAAAGLQFSTDC